MYITQKEQLELSRIMKSQRFSSAQVKGIVGYLKMIEKNHGIVFVVNRLKNMKAALLKSKDNELAKSELALFKGVFKCILDKSKTRRGMIFSTRIVSIYTRWEKKNATYEDWKAFETSVSKPLPDHGVVVPVSRRLKAIAKRIYATCDFSATEPQSKERIIPFMGSFELNKESEVPIETSFQIACDLAPTLMADHMDVFREFMRCSESTEEKSLEALNGLIWASEKLPGLHSLENTRSDGKPEEIVGRISALTTDGGMKVRFIANPNRIYQVATSRLQRFAAKLLKRSFQPEVSIFNSIEATDWIQSQLNQGVKLHALDLSAATDHFPFDLQIQILQDLVPDEYQKDVSLWAAVCRGKWRTPYGAISYHSGQPMGTNPSFAVFTLAHTLLIKSLGGNLNNFRVLGDDVIFSDEALAKSYQSTMNTLGVSISLTKSLLNSTIGEFAGRLVDKHGIMPVFKGRRRNISKDPTGYLRQYGLRAQHLLPKKDREKIKLAAKLDLNPLMRHLHDSKYAQSLPSEVLEQIYKDNTTPAPKYGWLEPYLSVFNTELTAIEERTILFGLTSSLVRGCINNSLHNKIYNDNIDLVRENSHGLVDPDNMIEKIKESLDFSSPSSKDFDKGIALPISRVTKIQHIVNAGTLVQA